MRIHGRRESPPQRQARCAQAVAGNSPARVDPSERLCSVPWMSFQSFESFESFERSSRSKRSSVRVVRSLLTLGSLSDGETNVSGGDTATRARGKPWASGGEERAD